MLLFSLAAHDFLYLYTRIRFSVNKSNYLFKGKSRISRDGLNNINLSIHFKFPNQTVFVEFSLASLGCNYMNLPRISRLSFLIGENKAKTIT